MTPDQRAHLLRELDDLCPSLAKARTSTLGALVDGGVESTWRRGLEIVTALESDPAIVFVLQGIAQGVERGPSGTERTLWIIRPGDVVGGDRLTGPPEPARAVVAIRAVRGLAVPVTRFLAVAADDPEIRVGVTRETTVRAERGAGRADEESGGLPGRLSRLLLDFSDPERASGGWGELAYPMTLGTMAELVDSTEEDVRAALTEMEESGSVRGIGVHLVVDADLLREGVDLHLAIVARGEFEAM